jgi:hypothetical protein
VTLDDTADAFGPHSPATYDTMTMKTQISLCLALASTTIADVRLPGLPSHHMVLQRDKPINRQEPMDHHS